MKTLKKISVCLALAFGLLLPMAAPAMAAEDVFKQVCTGPNGESQSTLCETNKKNKSGNPLYGPDGILTKAVKIFSFVIGFAAILMIMVGGLKYVIASGDSNSINSAKNTILYAIIGLAIAAVAQSISVFVISKL